MSKSLNIQTNDFDGWFDTVNLNMEFWESPVRAARFGYNQALREIFEMLKGYKNKLHKTLQLIVVVFLFTCYIVFINYDALKYKGDLKCGM